VEKRRNRRTLKKRIRRIISLSTFITVLFLSGAIISLILVVSRNFAEFQSDIACFSIQQELNSGMALKPLGLKSIEEIDKDSLNTKLWFNDLNKKLGFDNFIPYTKNENKLYIKVQVKGQIIYSNEPEATSDNFSNFYKSTESIKPILNSDGEEIGTIAVRVNPELLLGIVGSLLLIIIVISLLALIMSNILNRFLVIPIITPLKQLETKVKALSEGDHETALSTQIVLKKPLREIESLADSTNNIMSKLIGYNEMLESQKEALESQNEELEAQNEELTESKLQIQKQQAQLIQSEKMASVGLLTAAITHEINTPIGAINSNAQIVDMLTNELLNNSSLKLNEDFSVMLGQIKETNDVNLMACARIIEIIKSLKTFSRLDQAEFQEADINEGIKSVLVLTNNLLKRRITVHEEFGIIPLVKCFPGQLNQVFMNIIVNASQAIEGDGDIFIRTYQQDKDIFIEIRDTGKGIKEEYISKIFEPGFTTKGVGVGLGLGLFISYNIIQNHNGEISVKSELGKGAEFIIRIPACNDRT
jgi:signal transduction histidine kinase